MRIFGLILFCLLISFVGCIAFHYCIYFEVKGADKVKKESMSKAWAYQILKQAYPVHIQDWMTFDICEALLIMGFKGDSRAVEVNKFIEKLQDTGVSW